MLGLHPAIRIPGAKLVSIMATIDSNALACLERYTRRPERWPPATRRGFTVALCAAWGTAEAAPSPLARRVGHQCARVRHWARTQGPGVQPSHR
jgi:hypothetical protein